MAVLLAVLAGYLCGSIPFGLVIAHVRKVDLRQVGSGNIGATNAARALGKGFGVLVLVLDALKATVPILVTQRVFAGHPDAEWIVVAVAAAAFVGIFCRCLRALPGEKVSLRRSAALWRLLRFRRCLGEQPGWSCLR